MSQSLIGVINILLQMEEEFYLTMFHSCFIKCYPLTNKGCELSLFGKFFSNILLYAPRATKTVLVGLE